MIGIAIHNDSDAPVSLSFFEDRLRNPFLKYPEGVTVKSLFEDVLFDDGHLLELQQWIMSKGHVNISSTRLHASETLRDKIYSIRQHYPTGEIRQYDFPFMEDPFRYTSNVTDIIEQYTISANTSLALGSVNAKETVNICLFIHQTSAQKDFDAMRNSLAQKYASSNTYENKRRYLLLR